MQEDGCGLTTKRDEGCAYDSAESAFLRHRMKYSSHGNDPLLAIERYRDSMSLTNDNTLFCPERNVNVSVNDVVASGNHRTLQLTHRRREPSHNYQPLLAAHRQRELSLGSQSPRQAELGKKQDVKTLPSSLTLITTGAHQTEVLKPSKSLRLYLSHHCGPSIAPAGVRALATHKLRPVTSNTMIQGRRLARAVSAIASFS